MKEVVARDEKFLHGLRAPRKGPDEFEQDGDFMKTHFVTKFTEPGSQVSFYRNGASLTSAAALMCLPPAASRLSRYSRSPAPTG